MASNNALTGPAESKRRLAVETNENVLDPSASLHASALDHLDAAIVGRRDRPCPTPVDTNGAGIAHSQIPTTPPSTPLKPMTSFSNEDVKEQGVGTMPLNDPCNQPRSYQRDLAPKEFLDSYDLEGDKYQGYLEYGRGAWSSVRKGILRRRSDSRCAIPSSRHLPSPPSSPAFSGGEDDQTESVLAIKVPASPMSKRVLESEARILTWLHERSEHVNRFVVPFRGLEASTGSLVFDAVPKTLLSESRDSKNSLSTRNLSEPVVGAGQWVYMVRALIQGLQFLHSNGVVHGDIKPLNILVRPSSSFPSLDETLDHSHTDDDTLMAHPIFCDFSSAYVIQSDFEPSELSAITAEYAAPSLLRRFHGRPNASGKVEPAVATPEDDIFALAATLVVPAIGMGLYAEQVEMRRTMLALEGAPLEHVRNGDHALRVKKGGIVDLFLQGALEKDETKRWSIQQWMEVVEGNV